MYIEIKTKIEEEMSPAAADMGTHAQLLAHLAEPASQSSTYGGRNVAG